METQDFPRSAFTMLHDVFFGVHGSKSASVSVTLPSTVFRSFATFWESQFPARAPDSCDLALLTLH
jgi:hypothetical protein